MAIRDIEVVEDRSETSLCHQGFLKLRRLTIRNIYDDGSRSSPYACDIVKRPFADAVAVCLHRREGRRVSVVLKEGIRPPIYLRKDETFAIPEGDVPLALIEIVAGMIEDVDAGPMGLHKRAQAEAREEAGVDLDPDQVCPLGGPLFASPGMSDEKVFFAAVELPHLDLAKPTGDGTPMEEGTRAVILDLDEALERCRDGRIPDMKTEVALLRLADHIGYIPALRLFVEELPEDLRGRFRPPGLSGNEVQSG